MVASPFSFSFFAKSFSLCYFFLQVLAWIPLFVAFQLDFQVSDCSQFSILLLFLPFLCAGIICSWDRELFIWWTSSMNFPFSVKYFPVISFFYSLNLLESSFLNIIIFISFTLLKVLNLVVISTDFMDIQIIFHFHPSSMQIL